MNPVLHLLGNPDDELARTVIEAQQNAGVPVEVVRLDEVTDWHALVDRVMAADSIASW